MNASTPEDRLEAYRARRNERVREAIDTMRGLFLSVNSIEWRLGLEVTNRLAFGWPADALRAKHDLIEGNVARGPAARGSSVWANWTRGRLCEVEPPPFRQTLLSQGADDSSRRLDEWRRAQSPNWSA